MATPHVAGIAALIIGKAGRRKLTPAQVGAVIQATAQKLPCPQPAPYIPQVCRTCAGFVNDLQKSSCSWCRM